MVSTPLIAPLLLMFSWSCVFISLIVVGKAACRKVSGYRRQASGKV
jgi:hypothetical protein